MTKFEEFLKRNNLLLDKTNNEALTVCPYCNLNSFFVSGEKGECRMCGKQALLEEFAKEMELSLESSETGSSTKQVSRVEEKKREERFYHLWSMQEALSHKFGEQSWVVDKLLPVQTITALSGNPQNFKTWVTIELAKSVALGKAFLDHFQVTQGAVLIVNEEDHLRYLQKRFALLGVTGEAPIHLLSQEGVKIDRDEWLLILRSLIREHSIKLVIFDSFIRIHFCNENDAREMAHVLDRLRELTKEGVTVLLTHHHRKSGYGREDPSQSIRGSSDIAAAVDCHLSVERREDEILVRQNKLRVDEALSPFRVIISRSEEGRFEALTYGGEFSEEEKKKEKVKSVILDVLKDGEHSREDLYNKAKTASRVGENAIGEILKELVDEGEVIVRTGKHNKKFYSLKENPDNPVL